MARRLLPTLALLVLLLAGSASGAPTEPQTPDEAAAQIVAAHERGDAERLATLAAAGHPDPWQVIDALLLRAAPKPALAFAGLVQGPAVEALAGYARSRAAAPSDRRAQAAHRAVQAALRDGHPERALAAAADVGPNDTVTRIQVAFGRGLALRDLQRPLDAATAFRTAGDAAAALGWWLGADACFLQAGIMYELTGDLGKAQVLYAIRLKTARRLADPRFLVPAHARLGRVERLRGRHAEAVAHQSASLGLARKAGDRFGEAAARVNLANALMELGRPSEALPHARQAEQIFAELGARHARSRAAAQMTVGSAQAALGRTAQGLGSVDAALETYTALADRRGMATARSNRGKILEDAARYADALRDYEWALEEHRKRGAQRAVGDALHQIGSVFGRLHATQDALRRLDEALVIWRRLGDAEGAAHTLGALATVHEQAGEVEQALALHAEALALHRKLGNRAGESSVLHNMGMALHELGRDDEGLAQLEAAGRIAREQGDRRREAETLIAAASVEIQRANDAAMQALQARARVLLEGRALPGLEAAMAWHEAQAHLLHERPAEAAAVARRGVELVTGLTRGLGSTEGAAARDQFLGLFRSGVFAAYKAGDPAGVSWFLEHSRAAMMREGLYANEAVEAALVDERLRAALTEARARHRTTLHAQRALARRAPLRARAAAERAVAEARREVHAAIGRIQREGRGSTALLFPEAASLEEVTLPWVRTRPSCSTC